MLLGVLGLKGGVRLRGPVCSGGSREELWSAAGGTVEGSSKGVFHSLLETLGEPKPLNWAGNATFFRVNFNLAESKLNLANNPLKILRCA